MKEIMAAILALCLTITTFGILALPASAAAWHANFNQSGSVAIKGEEELELDEDNFVYKPQEVTKDLYLDFEDGSAGGFVLKPGWEVKDGMLCGYQAGHGTESDGGYPSISFPINLGYGRDFVYETKFRINNFGAQCGMQIGYPGYNAHCGFQNTRLVIDGNTGELASEKINLDDKDWHNLKIVTSNGGSKQTYYFDGKPVLVCNSNPTARADGYLYIYVNANEGPEEWCGMDIEYIKITTTRYDLKMDLPRAGAEYLENSRIDFTSHLKKAVKPEDAPSIDYVINGQVVATGQAPDARASVSNLPAGTYEVTAVCGDYKSAPVTFTVCPSIKGELLAELDGSGKLFASLNVFHESNIQLDEVVYVLDGNVIGSSATAPYSISTFDISLNSHNLVAICRNKNGVILEKYSEKLSPAIPEEKATLNYASEISYTVSGDGGTAEVDVRNGNHRLYLKHSKDTFYFRTDTGEETAAAGLGDYRIITDGPYADIYHNGQMVASMYMPRCGLNKKEIVENGLKVENYKAVVPEECQNYLVKRDVTDKEQIYVIDHLPFYYNVDFVANKDNEFRLAINDSYYQGDITLRNGKFYAWTTQKESSPAYEMEIADAVDTDKNVYYRLETAAGICRLYGNGRWLGTFRGVHAIGEPALAINVTKGTLPYVAVSDNVDIYYSHEDFKDNGTLYVKEDAGECLQQTHVISERQLRDMSCDKTNQKANILAVNTVRGDVLTRGVRMAGVAKGDAVLVDVAASYIGAVANIEENGDLVLEIGVAKVVLSASELTQKEGKTYVKLSVLAEKFNLYLAEKGNVKILSPYDGWGTEQMKAIVSTVDPFATEK